MVRIAVGKKWAHGRWRGAFDALGLAGALLSYVIFLVGWAVVRHFDFMGIDSAAERASANVFARLSAPFYDSKGRDNIVVVLLTEESLAADGTHHWPLSYEHYSQIFGAVLAQKPRAVFVDLGFGAARPFDGTLPDGVEDLNIAIRNAGVPVLFTPGPSGQGLYAAQYPGVIQEPRVPVRALAPGKYALYQEAGAGNLAAGAALALQQAACKSAPFFARITAAGGHCDAIDTNAGGAPLLVRWGIHPPSSLPYGGIAAGHPVTLACGKSTTNGFGQLARGVSLAAAGVKQNFESSVSRDTAEPDRLSPWKCLSTAWLPVNLIRQPGAPLADKIVLIGAGRSSSADFVSHPGLDEVPGVFIHAMALDNLFTYGAGYPRETGSSLGLQDTEIVVLVAGLVGIALFAGFALWYWRPDAVARTGAVAQAGEWLLLWMVRLGLLVMLTFALLALYLRFNLPSFNLVTLAAMWIPMETIWRTLRENSIKRGLLHR